MFFHLGYLGLFSFLGIFLIFLKALLQSPLLDYFLWLPWSVGVAPRAHSWDISLHCLLLALGEIIRSALSIFPFVDGPKGTSRLFLEFKCGIWLLGKCPCVVQVSHPLWWVWWIGTRYPFWLSSGMLFSTPEVGDHMQYFPGCDSCSTH